MVCNNLCDVFFVTSAERKVYKVQRRQWRKDHCDGHYAAAIFRYKRELAVKFSHS